MEDFKFKHPKRIAGGLNIVRWIAVVVLGALTLVYGMFGRSQGSGLALLLLLVPVVLIAVLATSTNEGLVASICAIVVAVIVFIAAVDLSSLSGHSTR